ncbi:hypothetical protein ACH5RR_011222 [Cinchona calisaya]|uniref:Calmodulin-binding domain-containing protein n=1 Tax=Cinchona calisaya TaxID=153742 RepID=A0ABD3A493_9GENT
MAEKTINSMVTCKKSESDGSSSGNASIRKPSLPDNEWSILPRSNRTSTDSHHDFNYSRRNSTGKPILQNINQKIVPHYLRASTGSCHDFCKYGRKHAFEKERRPFPNRIIRTPSDKNNPAVTVSLGERKKETVSPDMKSNSLKHGASSGAIDSADPPEKEKHPFLKRIIRTPSDKQSPTVTVSLGKREKVTEPKKMISFDMKSPSQKHRASPGVIESADPPEKERHPFLKRIIRTPSVKQNPAVTVSLREREKVTLLKQMISSDMKYHSSKHGALPDAVDDPPEIIKQEVLLPSKQIEGSQKCDPLSHKKSITEKRMNNFSDKHSPSVRPPLTKQSTLLQTLKSAKKANKDENMSNLLRKCSPSAGSQPSAKKVEKAEKTMNILSQKCFPSLGPQRTVSKSSSFHIPQSTNGRGKIKDDMKASKNVVATKASSKKVVATCIGSLSPKPSISRIVALGAKKNRSLKVVSLLKDQNRKQKAEMENADGEKPSEKTLHVIVTKTKNNVSESTEANDVVPSLAPPFPSPKSLSQPRSLSLLSHEDGGAEEEDEEEEGGGGELEDYDAVDEEEEVEDEIPSACETTGHFISKKNRMANNNTGKVVEGNPRKTLRKGVVFSESKDPTPVKLKFRRGKVVNLQSETNGPRRLRFCRGRVMEENHERRTGTRRRNFKKKGPDGDGNATDPINEKVVLRHQDVQGRKDAQGLFNNVIEETASKLVESRKSKVKALVGAFETVISLQDTKPSPLTVS